MQTPAQPVLRDIVLVGGGHSHVGVLRRFAMKPIPGVRLTLICRDTDTPYSGMLPGYVAGHYAFDQVHIDLSRLAHFAGARFLRDEVTGLDRDGQWVLCRQRPPVAYDVVSVNIGSAPRLDSVDGAEAYAVPVKPIDQFNHRWQAVLERIKTHRGRFVVAVVGGGAGGVELLLSVQYRLAAELTALGRNPADLELHIFHGAGEFLPTHDAAVSRKFHRVLANRGVQLHLNTHVTRVSVGSLQTDQGEAFSVDEVLWVTQAGGQAWLAATGLALDNAGFILVEETLQSITDPRVFAAGDVATLVNAPREKAGVFAVRQGPPLAENLRRSVLGKPLRRYHPQRRWLALISTGDRFAVGSRGPLAFSGRWVWRWKDLIDRRFMRRFSELPSMAVVTQPLRSRNEVALNADEQAQAISALAMRCGGCGAKVGSTVLTRALAGLRPVERDDVLVGLHAPDDAAVVRVAPGMAAVHTVDFFRAFIDDPYLFGKIAANHALGDIFAMGAEAQSATAIATVPYGLESKVEALLLQMMTGAVEVLNQSGCALVGGHTGEGQELALGFAVNGVIDPKAVLGKSGMRPGDALILTKPLGTGTLFAAHAQLRAKGRWLDTALESMVQSSEQAATFLRRFGATACTDVTGFGLLGHLLEMTRPSAVDAYLDLAAIPLLPGALETAAAGILSSLQPANLRLRSAIRNQAETATHPAYPLLFDPQTAGGLLASVPQEKAVACIAALRETGYSRATVIGRVAEQSSEPQPVILNR